MVEYHHLGTTNHHRRGLHWKWALNGKEQVFFELSAHEPNVLHTFLVNNLQVKLQPSSELTLARNSMFLNEMLASKKQSWIFWIKEQDILPVLQPMS